MLRICVVSVVCLFILFLLFFRQKKNQVRPERPQLLLRILHNVVNGRTKRLLVSWRPALPEFHEPLELPFCVLGECKIDLFCFVFLFMCVCVFVCFVLFVCSLVCLFLFVCLLLIVIEANKIQYSSYYQVTTVLRAVAGTFDIIISERWNVDVGIPDHYMYMMGYNMVCDTLYCFLLLYFKKCTLLISLTRFCFPSFSYSGFPSLQHDGLYPCRYSDRQAVSRGCAVECLCLARWLPELRTGNNE